jgi:hypothetical protein
VSKPAYLLQIPLSVDFGGFEAKSNFSIHQEFCSIQLKTSSVFRLADE